MEWILLQKPIVYALRRSMEQARCCGLWQTAVRQMVFFRGIIVCYNKWIKRQVSTRRLSWGRAHLPQRPALQLLCTLLQGCRGSRGAQSWPVSLVLNSHVHSGPTHLDTIQPCCSLDKGVMCNSKILAFIISVYYNTILMYRKPEILMSKCWPPDWILKNYVLLIL